MICGSLIMMKRNRGYKNAPHDLKGSIPNPSVDAEDAETAAKMLRRCCSEFSRTFDRFPTISSKMLVVSRRCAIFFVDILKRHRAHLLVGPFFTSFLSAIQSRHFRAPDENSVPFDPSRGARFQPAE